MMFLIMINTEVKLYTHTYRDTHTHTHTLTHTHARSHTHTHTHAQSHTHIHTHAVKEHTHINSKSCNHEISVTVVLYTEVIQLTLMSCHCSVEVSTECTGAAGPFLLGGTYTGRLYSRVATLVCLDFAFLVFSFFWGQAFPNICLTNTNITVCLSLYYNSRSTMDGARP